MEELINSLKKEIIRSDDIENKFECLSLVNELRKKLNISSKIEKRMKKDRSIWR